MRKAFIRLIPYVIVFILVNKLCLAFRLTPGMSITEKIISLKLGLQQVYLSPKFSLHPTDILITVVTTGLLWMILYTKHQNIKKYRKGIEYGSARWGNSEDIKPYMDKEYANNILLTKTESLTMNNRPPNPKYARNKNVLVIGGSGSGKTRFYVKPNIMQMHSSYVITDPKGTLLADCGKMLTRKGGYQIKVLNTINLKKSMRYNPFQYIRSEKDILKLVNTIILNTKGDGDQNSDNSFWVKQKSYIIQLLSDTYGMKHRKTKRISQP